MDGYSNRIMILHTYYRACNIVHAALSMYKAFVIAKA
jgi:hypothetical protein